MAAAFTSVSHLAIRQAIAIGTHSHAELPPQVEWIEASHPYPDARSEAAGNRAIAVAQGVHSGEALVILLSGGASALMASPMDGLSLADKIETTRLMMTVGRGHSCAQHRAAPSFESERRPARGGVRWHDDHPRDIGRRRRRPACDRIRAWRARCDHVGGRGGCAGTFWRRRAFGSRSRSRFNSASRARWLIRQSLGNPSLARARGASDRQPG